MTALSNPNTHAAKAKQYEQEGKYLKAAHEWDRARMASGGHHRRARYSEHAEECYRLYNQRNQST